MVTQVDNLGISEVENKQIKALSLGASRKDVANLTKQPLDKAPEFIPSAGFFDDESQVALSSGFDDFTEEDIPISSTKAAEKSMYAALANDTNVGEDYYRMYNEYLSVGESPTFQAIQQQLRDQGRSGFLQVLDDTAAAGDADGLQTLLEASGPLLEEQSSTKLRGLENAVESLTEAHGRSPRSEEYKEKFLQGFEDYSKIREGLDRSINSAMADTDAFDLWRFAQDNLEVSVVGEQLFQLSGVGKDIFGESYSVLGGTMFRDLAQHVNSFPIEEQPEVVEKIIDSIIKNSGNLRNIPLIESESRNEFLKFYALDSFRTFLNTAGGDDPVERWMLDVFGVLSATPLIPIATLGKWLKKLKLLKGSIPNTMKYIGWRSELAEANPRMSGLMQEAALRDKAAARDLGTTQERELGNAMPGGVSIEDDYVLDGAPNSLVSNLKGLKTKEDEITSYLDNTFNYHDADYIAKIKKIWDILEDNKNLAYAKPSKSSFIERNDNANSILTRYLYGDDTDLDVSLFKASVLASKIKEGLRDSGIKSDPIIYIKDRTTGTYEEFIPETADVNLATRKKRIEKDVVDVSRDYNLDISNLEKRLAKLLAAQKKKGGFSTPRKTEIENIREEIASLKIQAENYFKTQKKRKRGFSDTYLVSVDMETPMYYSDIVPGSVLEEGATKGVGKLGRWVIPPQSYINQTLMGAGRVANDSMFFIKHNLLGLADPFLKLPFNGKRKVANLLEVGEEEGKVFSYRELQTKGYSLEETEAYFSARLFNDAVYRIKNRDTRRSLENDGVQSLTITNSSTGDIFENGISIVNMPTIVKNTTNIFDPVTGEAIAATEKNLTKLAEKGIVFGKLLRKVDTPKGEFTYVAVPQNSIHDLPKNVIPYAPGYNFRINNDPYFIDRRRTVLVNGRREEVQDTIAVARNRHEADGYVRDLSKASPDVKFEVRIDRNINSSKTLLDNEIDALDGSGLQFWFSKRGPRLTRRDGSLSSVEDPVSAMHALSTTVANVYTHKEFVNTSIIRHQKTYGHLEVNGRKLWSYDPDVKSMTFDKAAAKEAGRADVKAAMREYEWIENMKYSPTDLDVRWKGMLEDIDASMARTGNLGSTISGKLTKGLAPHSPQQVVRGASFTLAITMQPFRQVALQSLTGLHLTGIDPLITAKSFADAPLIMLGLATYQNPKNWEWIKGIAKAVGYSEKDFEEMFHAFRKSGKAYSIDSNVMIGEANLNWSRSLPETKLGHGVEVLVNIAKSPLIYAKLFGFDTGELFNQAATWAFARRMYQKENPGKSWTSKRALDEITNRARAHSIDMTKTDQMPYQQGAFSAMTQFMAINNKFLMKILPEVMGGDPNFKGSKMKAKYVLGMLAVFGASGLGVFQWYDAWKKESGLDIPPQLDDLMAGGIFLLLFNSSLDLIFGEEWGTTRTAASESFSPASGQFTFAIDMAENILDGNFVEAFAGPSGNLLPQIAEAYKFGNDVWGMDDLDTNEKLIKSMTVAMQQFGFMSNYFKFNLAMAYQEKLDELHTVGRDGRPTAPANAASEVYAKLLLGVSTRAEEELFNYWIPKRKDYVSSGKENVADADKDADQLVTWMFRTWAESKDEWDFAEKAQALTFSLHKADRDYGMRVREAAMYKFKRHPDYAGFIQQIAEKWIELDPEANKQEMINLIKNSDLITDETEKDNIIYSIEQLTRGKEQSRELLDKME